MDSDTTSSMGRHGYVELHPSKLQIHGHNMEILWNMILKKKTIINIIYMIEIIYYVLSIKYLSTLSKSCTRNQCVFTR